MYHELSTTSSSLTAYEKAEQNGQVVVVPRNNELFVDLDTEESITLFKERIKEISRYVGIKYSLLPSKSGNKHGYVELDRNINSDYERLFLQLLLGSDPIRELLSWGRVVNNDPTPTLFFENSIPANIPYEEVKVPMRGINLGE
jgi:hypothetical protein